MLNEKSIDGTLAQLTRWLSSLLTAKEERVKESVAALRQIMIAVRETSTYLGDVAASGQVDARIEARLAREWTKLSHLMRNIGNAGLARRCLVKGGIWADASALSAEYIESNRAALSGVEKLAETAARQAGIAIDDVVDARGKVRKPKA